MSSRSLRLWLAVSAFAIAVTGSLLVLLGCAARADLVRPGQPVMVLPAWLLAAWLGVFGASFWLAARTVERAFEPLAARRRALGDARQLDAARARLVTEATEELHLRARRVRSEVDALLVEPDTFNDEQLEDLRLMAHAARQLVQLTDDLADLSGAGAARALVSRPLDLAALCREALDAARRMIASSRPARPVMAPSAHRDAPSLEVLADIPPSLWIEGDESLLRRVIDNLLGNALKFTRRGHVHLALREGAEETVELVVSDTGVGIDPQDLARLFDPFRQAAAGRERGQGFGLGLAICRRAVEQHGGTITVESVPGQGTRVSAMLPRHALATGVGHP